MKNVKCEEEHLKVILGQCSFLRSGVMWQNLDAKQTKVALH